MGCRGSVGFQTGVRPAIFAAFHAQSLLFCGSCSLLRLKLLQQAKIQPSSPMHFNEVKKIFDGCPDLVGLDDSSRARLFWRAECQTFLSGANIYTENTPLDNSFGLLLSGTLLIERSWKVLGQMKGNPLFGEMAYFTKFQERTASVRAGSAEVQILRFYLAKEELADSHFAGLKKFLGVQAWERFVSSSQREP
jgi:hypothetical protein